MPDVFLSYSREDQLTARRFAEALKQEGFEVWWDQALSAGEVFDKVTEKALDDARAVVVLWSKHSVQSDWVRAEATQARANHRLVPVTIEPCKRPIMFELTHTADLSGWNGDIAAAPWRAFIEGLRRMVGKTSTSTATSFLPPEVYAPRTTRPVSKTAIAWSAVVAAVFLTALVYWTLQGRDARAPTATAAPPAAATATPTNRASIAVLPFKDMSQKKDQEYFADGVTEEILNTLAGLKNLKVSARTSAFSFKGKDVDLRTVGETLGVQHILEGSIRKDGDTLRITAQLIDTKSDAHVWSKTYDRPLKDIFKVQEEIARSVAEALQVALGVGFGNEPGMTRDVEAYDAFLAARPLLIRFNAETQRAAIGLLEQAVRRDPNFGKAWIWLADAYWVMAALVPEGAQAWRQKGDAAIENARRLAPDSPELHYELAERSINQGHWTEAAGHIKDAEAGASTLDLLCGCSRGRFFLLVGKTREGLAVVEQEKARDPLNPSVSFLLGTAYFSVRDFPASTAEFKRGSALDPTWQYLFQLGSLSNAFGARDQAEVRRLMDDLIVGSPNSQAKEFNVRIRSVLDHPADALAHFRKLSRDSSTGALDMGGISQWLAYYGDPKSSLEALRFTFERGSASTASVSTWYPVMRDVRKLPEFKQLMRDVGFVDYWKKYGWGDFCKPTTGDDFECT